MTIIAATGVVIATAALFLVLAGFSGLKDFSLQFSSFVDPDLKIEAAQGKSFHFTDTERNKLKEIKGIEAFSKVVEERVILEFNNKNRLATLKGVDSTFLKVTQVDSMLIQGQWFKQGTGQVVSGWGIAHHLSFGILDYGKTLKIYVPKPGQGQVTSVKGAFNSVTAVNIGIFDINEDLNDTYMYSDLVNAQYLLNYEPNQISAIEIKTSPKADQKAIIAAIHKAIDTEVVIKNRAQLNDALYKMLNTENLAVYLIFTLVIIIALFNVIGAIIMMILDKKLSLHTLYNMGATAKDIQRIFFLQGSLMTLFGGLFGLALGLALVLLQQEFSLLMITPTLPYPVSLEWENSIVVIVTIVVLGMLASKIASGRINKQLVKT